MPGFPLEFHAVAAPIRVVQQRLSAYFTDCDALSGSCLALPKAARLSVVRPCPLMFRFDPLSLSENEPIGQVAEPDVSI